MTIFFEGEEKKMLAIREVILDEKLNEVAYVVSGTMQEFGDGESCKETRRVLNVDDLVKNHKDVTPFVSYASGKLEFPIVRGSHYRRVVEHVYVTSHDGIKEIKAEIKIIGRLKKRTGTFSNPRLSNPIGYRIEVEGKVTDVAGADLFRLSRWMPIAGGLQVICVQKIGGFYYSVNGAVDNIIVGDGDVAYDSNIVVEDTGSIGEFIKFIASQNGTIAVKRPFDTGSLSDSLVVEGISEYEIAEPKLVCALDRMTLSLKTKRSINVRFSDGCKVYPLNISGEFTLVKDGELVVRNMLVIFPKKDAIRAITEKYGKYLLIQPVKGSKLVGGEVYSIGIFGIAVTNGLASYSKIRPVTVAKYCAEKHKVSTQMTAVKLEICEASPVRSAVIPYDGGNDAELSRLRGVGVDTMSGNLKVTGEAEKSGVGVRFEYEAENVSVPEAVKSGSLKELEARYEELSKQYAELELTLWLIAHSRFASGSAGKYASFYAPSWGLKYVGEERSMHAYETNEEGFRLLINGEVVTEDRAVLAARKGKGRKRGRPRKDAVLA
jgi:hypothetical protein